MDALSSVSSEAELVALLKSLLALVPSTTNPWSALGDRLEETGFPKEPAAAQPLLLTASVLSAVCTLGLSVAFIVRWKRNTLWLCRIVQARSHMYIMWHYSMSWASGLVVLLLSFQGYIWSCWKVAGGDPVPDLLLWITLPWCAGISQVAVCCWSLATTYLLHLKTYTAQTRREWPWFTSARFVNPAFFFLCIVDFAAIVPLAVTASNHYKQLLGHKSDIHTLLESAAASWTGTTDTGVVGELAPLIMGLLDQQNLAASWFQYTSGVCAAFAVALELLFLLIAVLYLVALRRSLKNLSGSLGKGVDAFARTLHGLVRITAAFLVLMTLLAINAVWVTVLAKDVLTHPLTRMLAAVLPIYCVVVSAIPASVLIVYQAATTYPSFPSSASTASTPPPSQKNPSSFKSLPKRSTLRRSASAAARRDLQALHYAQWALASQELPPTLSYLSYAADPSSPRTRVDPHPESPFIDLEMFTQRRDSPSNNSNGLTVQVDIQATHEHSDTALSPEKWSSSTLVASPRSPWDVSSGDEKDEKSPMDFPYEARTVTREPAEEERIARAMRGSRQEVTVVTLPKEAWRGSK
ncbi:hypothetical protein JCM8547_007206 [Rhodosporidiobolus lusitaniae]